MLNETNSADLLELSSSDWVTRHHTVLLTGPTGVGNSYIASALGNSAARQGHTVLYLRAPPPVRTVACGQSRRLPSQNADSFS
jgi:DNA replication protein DnaC